jgi:hypothetical protein
MCTYIDQGLICTLKQKGNVLIKNIMNKKNEDIYTE